jgi:hypothetical protein
VLKLFVLIEELDRNMAIFFLQDGCATLVEGLDLVNDCGAKLVKDWDVEAAAGVVGGLCEMTPPYEARSLCMRLPKAAQKTRRRISISSSVRCRRLLREVTST